MGNCLQAPAGVLIIQWTGYGMEIEWLWDFLVLDQGSTSQIPTTHLEQARE